MALVVERRNADLVSEMTLLQLAVSACFNTEALKLFQRKVQGLLKGGDDDGE